MDAYVVQTFLEVNLNNENKVAENGEITKPTVNYFNGFAYKEEIFLHASTVLSVALSLPVVFRTAQVTPF